MYIWNCLLLGISTTGTFKFFYLSAKISSHARAWFLWLRDHLFLKHFHVWKWYTEKNIAQVYEGRQVFSLSIKKVAAFPSSISCHAISGYVKLICSWHLLSSCDAVSVLSIGNKRGTERTKYKGNEISVLSCTEHRCYSS